MPALKWTKQAILDELRRIHASGESLAYTRLQQQRQDLVSAAAYHFGSYRDAVREAGIEYGDHVVRGRWTRSRIAALISAAHLAGVDLSWCAVTRRGDDLSRAAFATLQPRLFGSWEEALLWCGIPREEVSRYRKWDADALVEALREMPLSSMEMQQVDPGIHAAAIRHFGFYEDALLAAGHDPDTIYQRFLNWPAGLMNWDLPPSELARIWGFNPSQACALRKLCGRTDPPLWNLQQNPDAPIFDPKYRALVQAERQKADDYRAERKRAFEKRRNELTEGHDQRVGTRSAEEPGAAPLP